MDRLSVIGVVLALVALLGGSVLKGAGLSGLWSPAAFVIVILGTCASIMLQTPMATARRALQIVRWVFRPPSHDSAAVIAKIVEWSSTARKQGLLGLEAEVEAQADPFLKKGLAGKPVKQPYAVRQDSHQLLGLQRPGPHIHAVDRGGTEIRPQQPGGHGQRGGLACTVGTHDPEKGPCRDIQADAVHSDLPAEPFGQPAH